MVWGPKDNFQSLNKWFTKNNFSFHKSENFWKLETEKLGSACGGRGKVVLLGAYIKQQGLYLFASNKSREIICAKVNLDTNSDLWREKIKSLIHGYWKKIEVRQSNVYFHRRANWDIHFWKYNPLGVSLNSFSVLNLYYLPLAQYFAKLQIKWCDWHIIIITEERTKKPLYYMLTMLTKRRSYRN